MQSTVSSQWLSIVNQPTNYMTDAEFEDNFPLEKIEAAFLAQFGEVELGIGADVLMQCKDGLIWVIEVCRFCTEAYAVNREFLKPFSL